MNISAKTEYACIAVLELAAKFGGGEPIRIRTIADAHGIPSRFLVQILLQLKGAGIVASTRGAAGGYQLVKDPSQITLGEVMSVIDGQAAKVSSNLDDETPITRALLQVWNQVSDEQHNMLTSITFADLAEKVKGETENMYYI